ncbi:MAG TPA: hypothetical protein VLT45_20235 [Kofleriaceae bacterium]|nr:hypothetical protein [Kofleriaceae bacterium]
MKVVALLLAGCAQTNVPHLTSATPAATSRGGMVTIVGERMCAGDCTTAGGEFAWDVAADPPSVQLPVVTLEDTRAQVMIPTAAGTGNGVITLTVNDTSSNALAFTVLAP